MVIVLSLCKGSEPPSALQEAVIRRLKMETGGILALQPPQLCAGQGAVRGAETHQAPVSLSAEETLGHYDPAERERERERERPSVYERHHL